MADRKFTSDEIAVTIIVLFVLGAFASYIPRGTVAHYVGSLAAFNGTCFTIGYWINRRAELLEWFKATLRSEK